MGKGDRSGGGFGGTYKGPTAGGGISSGRTSNVSSYRTSPTNAGSRMRSPAVPNRGSGVFGGFKPQPAAIGRQRPEPSVQAGSTQTGPGQWIGPAASAPGAFKQAPEQGGPQRYPGTPGQIPNPGQIPQGSSPPGIMAGRRVSTARGAAGTGPGGIGPSPMGMQGMAQGQGFDPQQFIEMLMSMQGPRPMGRI